MARRLPLTGETSAVSKGASVLTQRRFARDLRAEPIETAPSVDRFATDRAADDSALLRMLINAPRADHPLSPPHNETMFVEREAPPLARPIAPKATRNGATLRAVLLGVAAFAAPLAFWAATGLLLQNPAALAAMAALPATLIAIGLIARHDAIAARAQASEVTALARRAFLPSAEHDPLAAFGQRIRGEIAAFDAAAASAFERLKGFDSAAGAHAEAFEAALQRLDAQAQATKRDFADELDALAQLSAALRTQSEAVEATLGAHANALRQASAGGVADLAAAERALMTQFGMVERASAALAERAQDLRSAGAEAADAAGTLDQTLSEALDALAESTSLNETARRSIETAAKTAAAAAAAVRDATREAIGEPERDISVARTPARAVAQGRAAQPAGDPEPSTRAPWRGFSGVSGASHAAKMTPTGFGHQRPRLPLEVFEAAGVDLDRALPSAALERIAQRSPLGRAARQRATLEAAEDSVARLARYLGRAPAARVKADQFREDPGLSNPSLDAEGGPRLARAYLLIDAALG